MGMADFILAGEGDLYDINEYHMLAHLIINKVEAILKKMFVCRAPTHQFQSG